MPMDRKRYPDDWEEIARRVKDEAGWRCERCGRQCRRPGEPFDTHRRTLTVAHLDHTPENCARSNLRALCAPCHLRYDAAQHAESRKKGRASENAVDRKGEGRAGSSLMLTVRAEFAEAILDGTKRYEYRKTAPARPVDFLVLCQARAHGRVVCVAEVAGTVCAAPKVLWELTGHAAGIDHDRFCAYFAGMDSAVAFRLGRVWRAGEGVSVRALGRDRAPQCFVYVDTSLVSALSESGFERLEKDGRSGVGIC